jgi:hypothetical protein
MNIDISGPLYHHDVHDGRILQDTEGEMLLGLGLETNI